jgi:hypothetical protein
MADQTLQINVVTKADTSGLDEVKTKLDGVSSSIADQLAAAGAQFDPIKGGFVSATKEAENFGASATIAGASLYKARGEALTLAREMATGSYNARTLGALLGSMGTPITVAAVAMLGLWSLIKGARDDLAGITKEEKKATDELDQQISKWTELAKAASSFSDVVKVEEQITAGLDKAATAFDQVQKKTLTFKQQLVDAFASIPGGLGIKGFNPFGVEQPALEAEKKAFQELFQMRLEEDVALDEAAKRAVADWERIQAGPPSEGISELTQRIAGLNDQLTILDAKRLPPLGATPAELAAAKAAQDEYTKINAEKVVLQKHLGDEIKSQDKLDEQATRDQRKETNQQLNEILREQQTIIQGIRQQQQLIQGNTGLGPDEKQAALLASYTQEMSALGTMIARLQVEQKNTALDGPQMDQVNQKLQQARFEVQLLGQQMSALLHPAMTELQNWANSFGTTTHQMAATLKETVGAAFQSLNEYIVTGTFNLQSFLQQIELLGLKLIEQLAIQEVASLIGGSASLAQAKLIGPQIAAAYAGAATAVSTATYGIAAGVGTTAELAALATITGALVGSGGFREGGYTGDGSDGDIAGPAHRGEYYFTKEQTAALGIPFLQRMAASGGQGSAEANQPDITNTGDGWVTWTGAGGVPYHYNLNTGETLTGNSTVAGDESSLPPPADMSPGEFGTEAPGFSGPPAYTPPLTGGSSGLVYTSNGLIYNPASGLTYDPGSGLTYSSSDLSSSSTSTGDNIPSETYSASAPPMPNVPPPDSGSPGGWVSTFGSSGWSVLPGGSISTGGPWMPSDAPEFQGKNQPHGAAGSGQVPVRFRHSGGPVGDEFSFLKNGEFVMRDPAVQHYGVDLMHGINEMRVPMHHAGGAIGSLRSPASAKGGDVHVANFVDLKLLAREMSSRQGRRIIMDVLRGNRIELGL